MLSRITNMYLIVWPCLSEHAAYEKVLKCSLVLLFFTFIIWEKNAIFSCGPIIQATEVKRVYASFLSRKPKPTPKVSLQRALHGPWALHLNSLHTQPIHQTSPSSRLRCHGRYESQYRLRLTTQDMVHSPQKIPTQRSLSINNTSRLGLYYFFISSLRRQYGFQREKLRWCLEFGNLFYF